MFPSSGKVAKSGFFDKIPVDPHAVRIGKSRPMSTERPLCLRLGILLAAVLITMPTALAAPPREPKPLPEPVLSQAPGIRPLGHGRHTLWGIHMYDATLWIVGDQFAPTEPHALDVEPGKSVSSETLVKTATDEMNRLNLGNAARLAAWRQELMRLLPNVKSGDQVVLFCPHDGRTVTYYNGRDYGEVADPTLCPAIMNVWLHPQSKSKDLRKSLLGR
jgi:Chalcone isomerase-like